MTLWLDCIKQSDCIVQSDSIYTFEDYKCVKHNIILNSDKIVRNSFEVRIINNDISKILVELPSLTIKGYRKVWVSNKYIAKENKTKKTCENCIRDNADHHNYICKLRIINPKFDDYHIYE